MLLATVLVAWRRQSRSGTTRASSIGCEEQEKLLLAAKIEALASQINPHFLFNTLASISSLIRTQPETARMLITKLSGLLRRLMRSTDHFVTLREELESSRRVPRHQKFTRLIQLELDKQLRSGQLDDISMRHAYPYRLERSARLWRKVGNGRIPIGARATATIIGCTTMGWA